MNMDFIAGGLVELLGGIASALVLFGFAWWAPPCCSLAWGSTHWLLRESGVWRDRNTDEVQTAQRHADYAYRLAVDPPAAKEVRLFGLAPWVHRPLHQPPPPAARAAVRGHPAARAARSPARLLIVLAANVAGVLGRSPSAASTGGSASSAVVAFAAGRGRRQLDRLRRAELGARRRRRAGRRRAAPRARRWPRAGALVARSRTAADGAADAPRDPLPRRHLRLPDRPPTGARHFDLTIPAGTSLAIVGQNGAGKTTLAKLLCRLYDPQAGAIEVDGVDLRDLDVDDWRRR